MLLAAVTFIPLTVWVVSTVHWMLMGEIDALTGMCAIVAGVGLGAMTMKPPIPILSPVFCATVWLTVIFFPILRSSIDKRALVAIDLESLDRAYAGLRDKPDNVGLKLKVAKLLYGRGLSGHAIVVAEDAIKGMPEQLFHEELKMIEQWKGSAGGAKHVRSLPCLECGHFNPAGKLHCTKCGSPFLLHHARGKWLGPNLARRVMACWTAGLAMLAGIPFALGYLAAWLAGIVVTALAVASFAVVWRAFRPEQVTR